MNIIINVLMFLKAWMFIWTIIVLFVLSCTLILFKYRNSALALGNLMSYIGVIGTFVGIYQGLQSFNTNIEEITNSLPNLLAGMKTAFITSIVGMMANFTVKIICWIINGKNELTISMQYEKENQNMIKLFEKMEQHLNKQTLDSSQQIKNGFEHREILFKILANTKMLGDNIVNMDNSIQITSQVQNKNIIDLSTTMAEKITHLISTISNELEIFNNTFNDKLTILIQNFKKFENDISTDSVNAIINALNIIVQDFNSKINKQFGDNFEEFSLAVIALSNWQQDYSENVKLQTDIFSTNLEKVLVTISDLSKNIQEKLSSSAEENVQAITEYLTYIKNFAEETSAQVATNGIKISQELKEAMLNYQKDLLDELCKTIKDWSNEINKSIDLQTKQTKLQNENLKSTIDVIKLGTNNTLKELLKVISTINMGVENSMQNFMNNLGDELEQFSKTSTHNDFTEILNPIKDTTIDYTSSDDIASSYTVITDEIIESYALIPDEVIDNYTTTDLKFSNNLKEHKK
ncbi:hypothetical protein AN641_04425 [Candidatus Epulonipiscioides gigas]|nr:hypothetical protein AN641_04425 [Epulopiscium sp. SCG-C07WGA-EpuloA2]